MVKHLRTDGPQPIVLTSDADSQRLAAGGRPGADGVRVTDGVKLHSFGSERVSIGTENVDRIIFTKLFATFQIET